MLRTLWQVGCLTKTHRAGNARGLRLWREVQLGKCSLSKHWPCQGGGRACADDRGPCVVLGHCFFTGIRPDCRM